MEKVAEQHILQKCCKCSRFGVMSTLLKVATIAITHLAMDLGLKNTKQGQVFPMMDLSCKFGSSSSNILRDRKAFVKT